MPDRGWGDRSATSWRGAVVTAVDIDQSAAEETAASARGRIRAAQVDVVESEAVARSVGEVVAEHGRIDFVFNNAGVGGVVGEVRHFSPKHWDGVIDVNLRGVVNGIAAGYPVMVEQGSGHIVKITDAGLDTLQRWLSEPSSFPLLEAEPVVRAVFSDFGGREDLRSTITSFRDEAAARLAVLADMGEEYLNRRGLYQERFHLTMLTGRFVAHLMDAYVEWCEWALAGLDQWPEDLEGRHAWAEASHGRVAAGSRPHAGRH